MIRTLRILILFGALLFAPAVYAQLWQQLCQDSLQSKAQAITLRLDSTQRNVLGVKLDAMTFFRDNEYDSDVAKGYSLPGLWLQPRITYQPLRNVSLELGLHAYVMNGANKYPNYAYHDIATWKGNQYQSGAHVLPFFRVQADFRHLSLIMGNIHGAQQHRLILPMFNPEQNLSTDPEMGFQLLVDRRHIHLDTWLNWQSYIFEEDTHQEAFTVGTNATLLWGREGAPVQWSAPIQLLIQHRGGEQDNTAMGVQTLCNASAGLRMDYRPAGKCALNAFSAEINALGSYQQSGHLWPFTTGFAAHAAVSATLWNHVGLELGHMEIPKQYANLYGNPFFGTLSIKHPGLQFDGMHTTYLNADYHYTFASAYRLGAAVEAMYAQSPGVGSFVFSFGAYFRVSPSFVIKRFKRGNK